MKLLLELIMYFINNLPFVLVKFDHMIIDNYLIIRMRLQQFWGKGTESKEHAERFAGCQNDRKASGWKHSKLQSEMEQKGR